MGVAGGPPTAASPRQAESCVPTPLSVPESRCTACRPSSPTFRLEGWLWAGWRAGRGGRSRKCAWPVSPFRPLRSVRCPAGWIRQPGRRHTRPAPAPAVRSHRAVGPRPAAGRPRAGHQEGRELGQGVFADLSPTKRDGMEVRGPLREKPQCRAAQVAQRNAPRRYSGRASSRRTARSRSPPCPRFSSNVAAFLAPTFSARAHAMKWSSETPSRLARSSAAALSDLGRFNETRVFMTRVTPTRARGQPGFERSPR